VKIEEGRVVGRPKFRTSTDDSPWDVLSSSRVDGCCRLDTNDIPWDATKAADDISLPQTKRLPPSEYLGHLRIPPKRWLLGAGLNMLQLCQVVPALPVSNPFVVV
jgi:hypothetical protein